MGQIEFTAPAHMHAYTHLQKGVHADCGRLEVCRVFVIHFFARTEDVSPQCKIQSKTKNKKKREGQAFRN